MKNTLIIFFALAVAVTASAEPTYGLYAAPFYGPLLNHNPTENKWYANPWRWDESVDYNNNGWSNWSKRRWGSRFGVLSSDERLQFAVQNPGIPIPFDWAEVRHGCDPRDATQFPHPQMRFTIAYYGTNITMTPTPVIVWGYRDKTMMGRNGGGPDVIYQLAPATWDGYPDQDTLPAFGAITWYPLAMYHAIYMAFSMQPVQEMWTRIVLAPSLPPAIWTGHAREGIHYFMAFQSMDGTGIPKPGDPMGMSDNILTGDYVGWDHNDVSITMTDDPPYGTVRFFFAQPESFMFMTHPFGSYGDQTALIRVSSKFGLSGETPLPGFNPKAIRGRTFFHEGDVYAARSLTAGFSLVTNGSPVATEMLYAWSNLTWEANNPDGTINLYPPGDTVRSGGADVLKAPELVHPNTGEIITGPQIGFVWDMEENVSECAITIRKGSASGTVVYDGPALQHFVAPAGQAVFGTTGLVRRKYIFPIHVNGTFPNGTHFGNGTYYWRVTAYNRLNNSASSEWDSFTVNMDVQDPGTAFQNEIKVRVIYNPFTAITGDVLEDDLCLPVRVQAFRNRGFTGLPAAEVEVSAGDFVDNVATVRLRGLLRSFPENNPPVIRNYYIRAYIDCNANRVRDVWEPYGYVCYKNLEDYKGYNQNRFDVAPVKVGDPEVDLFIINADINGNRKADGKEYYASNRLVVPKWLEIFGGNIWEGLTGMSDQQLMEIGYNPKTTYSQNGLSHYDNVVLGSIHEGDVPDLRLTAFGIGDDASVGWKLSILNPDAENMGFQEVRDVEFNSGIGTAYGVLKFSESLAAPLTDWREVDRFKINETAGERALPEGALPPEPETGFIRALLEID